MLYHNSIRCIPDSVVYLQSLQFLDLSRNQISYLPTSICELPLQSLVVNNNKLVSLPEEIGKMATLMKLDASCNEITHLPVQIGDLNSLKVLNLRRNHLQEIPIGKSSIVAKIAKAIIENLYVNFENFLFENTYNTECLKMSVFRAYRAFIQAELNAIKNSQNAAKTQSKCSQNADKIQPKWSLQIFNSFLQKYPTFN